MHPTSGWSGALLLLLLGTSGALGACSSDEEPAGTGGASSGGSQSSGGSAGSGGTSSGGAAGSGGSAGSGGAGGATGGSGGGSGGSAGAGGNGGIGPSGGTLTPSGPITLTTGQTVTGLHITSTSGPCIKGNNVQNVRVTNNQIGPCGPGSEGVGIYLYGSHDVRVDHNSFDDVASAMYAQTDPNGNIVFDHNLVTRIRGPMPRGQMVQFDDIHGAGHRIACNISDQTVPGYQAGPEDHVSMYKSGGTAASRIEIAYNRLRGGGPSTSGSGVMTGDSGSEYLHVHHNTMVETANVGFAIAGGKHITLEQNRAFSPKNPYSNVGSYIWAQGGATCQDNSLIGNRTHWTNKEGTLNHFWDGGNCQNTTQSGNVWGDTSLTAAIFDQPYSECD